MRDRKRARVWKEGGFSEELTAKTEKPRERLESDGCKKNRGLHLGADG